MRYTFRLQQVTIPNTRGSRNARKRSEIDTVVYHRIKAPPKYGSGGAGIAAFFVEEGQHWIGTTSMPYAFIIPADQPAGSRVVVQQCCPLWCKTPHALSWNRRSVSVGVEGDFRERPPTKKQTAASVWLALRLRDLLTMHLQQRDSRTAHELLITVHGALTDGTRDPTKLIGGAQECPGKLFHPTWRWIRACLKNEGEVQV